jgi:hypothetical protein
VASSVGDFPKRPLEGATEAIVLIMAWEVVTGTSPKHNTNDLARGEMEAQSSADTVSQGRATLAYKAAART